MTFKECMLCDQQVAYSLTDRRKPKAVVLLCAEHYAEIGVMYRLKQEGRLVGAGQRGRRR